MAAPDLTLAQIVARFDPFAVAKSRGGYLLLDPNSPTAVARLRPFAGTDRFELLYGSAIPNRWRTFGNPGPMRLTLQEAHEIVIRDPMFQIRRTR